VVKNATDKWCASVKMITETEVRAIVQDEIRKSTEEKAIREAVEQPKRIIKKVMEEEKLTTPAKVDELSRCNFSWGGIILIG